MALIRPIVFGLLVFLVLPTFSHAQEVYVEPFVLGWNNGEKPEVEFERTFQFSEKFPNLLIEDSSCTNQKKIKCNMESGSEKARECHKDDNFSSLIDFRKWNTKQLIVRAKLKPGEYIVAGLIADPLPELSFNIDPDRSKSVKVGSFLEFTIPKNYLKNSENINIKITHSDETLEDYKAVCPLFAGQYGPRLPFSVRIKMGNTKPLKPLSVAVTLPESFRKSLPADVKFVPHIMEESGSELEYYDDFSPSSGKLSHDGKFLVFDILPDKFSKRRNKLGVFEAIFTIGTEQIVQKLKISK